MYNDLVHNLEPCPFCKGQAKISLREMRFLGQNGYGDKKIRCAAQLICNRCRARGPVYTANLINPYDRKCQQSEAFKWMLKEAAFAWNKRAGQDDGTA